MATTYIVHDASDLAFVERELLPPLPSLGFDWWISSRQLEGRVPVNDALSMCEAILVVVSKAAADSPQTCGEAALGLASGRPIIPVCIDGTLPDDMTKGMSAVTLVDLHEFPGGQDAEKDRRLARVLAELLPPAGVAAATDSRTPEIGERIAWSEAAFSQLLKDAASRYDFNRCDALTTAFTRHMAHRQTPYPPEAANSDLAALRKRRQFMMMGRYAEAALASGTADLKVRRQYGQALIEQGRFDQAREVLESVVRDSDRAHPESFEARGLIGRAYKQQYVDAPKAPGAPDLLQRAIRAYESAYKEDQTKLWHGINTASLVLRGHRDRCEWADAGYAQGIAKNILEEIEKIDPGVIDAWDLATKAEALVALEEYDEADRALTAYFAHPRMDAFEVSSTCRQFEQVLQLRDNPRGRPLLDRLWQAVERYRAGGGVQGAGSVSPMLVRVTDPAWQPSDVPDLVIQARLGRVISILGSKATVQALLQDQEVESVEESRPAPPMRECDKSVEFAGVKDTYEGMQGPFPEKGDHALIAVIDDGIDVLHGAFRDAQGRSRIVGIWDQRSEPKVVEGETPRQAPPGFSFGTYYSQDDIATFLEKNQVPAELGRNDSGHGTHVASIAAGRAAGAFAGGMAPEARLLVVIPDSRETIGYSLSHHAALCFIERVAAQLKLPVAVNVSLGMNAGAHDGKSSLEVAFDEFSSGGRAPGRVIVKSAGNERDKNGHAKISVRPLSSAFLRWTRVDPASPHERLELWWTADEFRFRLKTPRGSQSDWVSESQREVSGTFVGGGYRLQLTTLHVDNGDNQLRIDITGTIPGVLTGQWELEIVGQKVSTGGVIHAWIEKIDSEKPSWFEHSLEEMTLSVPATAVSVITVGAVAPAVPIVLSEASSFGPTRDDRRKPEVVAPGVGIKAAKAGTTDGTWALSGTSMAAPHVTGAVALALSRAVAAKRRWPTATQVSAALRQKTANYNGTWDPGYGYGSVDVAAFLAALERQP